MNKEKQPSIIIFYGLPGSGKGTQAERASDYFGFKHFNTGWLIEKAINDPKNQNDPIIQREKKLFDEGTLCTPEWVAELVKKAIVDLHSQKSGIIFSGSPRTLYEVKEIMPLMEELYGRENIYIMEIKIKPETTIFRNSNRKICEKCSKPLIYTPETKNLTECPLCGGKLITRTLDAPEAIKVRIKEYTERTAPVFDFLKQNNYKITEIDGELTPDEVAENILRELDNKLE